MAGSRKTFLGQLAGEGDKLFRGPRIEQYAALCYRISSDAAGKSEVLLITSRDSGRWVVPKGWAMPDKAPHQVAEREAWEEAGVKGKAEKRPFGYFSYLKTLNKGEKVLSLVQVHLLEVFSMEERFPESGQRKLAWFDPYRAAALIREPELQSLVRRLGTTAR